MFLDSLIQKRIENHSNCFTPNNKMPGKNGFDTICQWWVKIVSATLNCRPSNYMKREQNVFVHSFVFGLQIENLSNGFLFFFSFSRHRNSYWEEKRCRRVRRNLVLNNGIYHKITEQATKYWSKECLMIFCFHIFVFFSVNV